FVMVLMDLLVEDLRKADRDRLHNTEDAIQRRALEIRIVQKVVRDAVDVPRNADRPHEAERNQRPPWQLREKKKQRDEIGELRQRGENRNRVVSRVPEKRRIGCAFHVPWPECISISTPR